MSPLPPLLLDKIIEEPAGETRVSVKSPTNVWVMSKHTCELPVVVPMFPTPLTLISKQVVELSAIAPPIEFVNICAFTKDGLKEKSRINIKSSLSKISSN